MPNVECRVPTGQAERPDEDMQKVAWPCADAPDASEGVTLAGWLAARVAKAPVTSSPDEAIAVETPSSFSFS
jgi:hypothetical protein